MSDIPLDIQFAEAIQTLPDVPNIEILIFLKEAAYSVANIEEVRINGKLLQRQYGLDAIPPIAEIEWAAGLWYLIRESIIKAKIKKPSESCK